MPVFVLLALPGLLLHAEGSGPAFSTAGPGGSGDRGKKKVHIFIRQRLQVDKPEGAPAWLPGKIRKPKAKKVTSETLEEL